VEAVASGNKIALDLGFDAVLAVTHSWRLGCDVVEAHPVRLIDGPCACDDACIHQVARDLGLAIDRDGLAGQGAEINALAAAAEADFDTVMHQTLAVEAGAHTGAVEEIDGPLLDHAGTDTTQHVLAAPLLECDVGNAVLVEELAEEQARRAGADDRYLGPHAAFSARDPDALNTTC
jgi:hypothetical protein